MTHYPRFSPKMSDDEIWAPFRCHGPPHRSRYRNNAECKRFVKRKANRRRRRFLKLVDAAETNIRHHEEWLDLMIDLDSVMPDTPTPILAAIGRRLREYR